MLLLSIILPVYNDEKYIRDTLSSIYKQSLDKSKYELIIIDDGSTDETLKICRDFLQQYNDMNANIYTQSNKGVSAARNKGLEYANAKYVTFVDGDDILESNCLKHTISKLLKIKNIDLTSYLRTQREEELGEKGPSQIIIEQCNSMYSYMLSNTTMYDGYVTNKIFDMGIIKKNNIHFQEGITYWEDMLFVEQYLNKCTGKVLLLNQYCYYYRVNENSATFAKNPQKIARNTYSKAIVAFKILKAADPTSELYLRGSYIYSYLLIDYKIFNYRGIITKDQYLKLYNYTNGNLKRALHQVGLKRKIKYYLAKLYSKKS